MKIAVIVGSFPKLSETFILDHIVGLLDRGHHVDIFAKSKCQEHMVHPDVEKYNLMEKVYYLSSPINTHLTFIKFFQLFFSNLKNIKILLRSLNIIKYRRRALSGYLFKAMIPFLKGYDIIHCQFGTNGNLGALLKEFGVSGKLVTTFHGYDIRLGIEKGGGIYANLFHRGDCFLSISDYNYQNLIRFGLDERKIKDHPNGINLKRFPYKWRKNTLNRNEPIIILTTGRLVAEKGLEYAIQAIALVAAANPDINFQYHIIGEGPLREELEFLINKLQLKKIVHLLGEKTQDQVAAILQQSHFFILPSIAEALPVALMESQAVGLPAIATSVGSTDKIILEGKSGYLVPSMNINALSEKIEFLLQQPESWPEMGKIGRENVKKYFDGNMLNDRLVDVYNELLQNSKHKEGV